MAKDEPGLEYIFEGNIQSSLFLVYYVEKVFNV